MTYASAVATAKAVIGRKGKAVTLTRPGQGAVDPINQARGTASNKTGKFNCVGLPPGRSAEVQIGTLVGRRLMQFYMVRNGSTFDPEPGDLVPWGGKTYTLIWTATYDPDDSGSILTSAYGEVS